MSELTDETSALRYEVERLKYENAALRQSVADLEMIACSYRNSLDY